MSGFPIAIYVQSDSPVKSMPVMHFLLSVSTKNIPGSCLEKRNLSTRSKRARYMINSYRLRMMPAENTLLGASA